MKKRKAYTKEELLIIILAYLNRYVFLIAAIMVPLLLLDKEHRLLGTGIGCVVYAAYNLFGYLCRFKHIYCSYQDISHQKMTPRKIDWRKIKRSDAIGVPLIFIFLGTVSIAVSFLLY